MRASAASPGDALFSNLVKAYPKSRTLPTKALPPGAIGSAREPT
jgi:hypothetical protein